MGPFVIQSLYLVLSRWPNRTFTQKSEIAAFVFDLAAGVACLALLTTHLGRAARIAFAIVYLLVMVPLLFFFSLLFVGYAFGDWL